MTAKKLEKRVGFLIYTATVAGLRITYSIADQHFAKTNSLGMMNLSLEMLEYLAKRPEVERLDVLSNSSLSSRVKLRSDVPVHVHDEAVAGKFQRMLWDQRGVYAEAKKLGNTWLFLPKGFPSFTSAPPVKLASCVADTYLEYYKEHYPKTVPLLERLYFDYSVRAAIKHSRVIFTISDYTSGEVAKLAAKLGLNPPVIRTIGIGFFRKSKEQAEKQNRILLLAGRFPHKRTDLALEFMSQWQERTEFEGTVEWVGRIPAHLKFPDYPRWILHPRIPDEQFYELMSGAKALVYFSDYEGFGMPPVEAAIAGTCPVFSSLPATREVMAESGYAFDNKAYASFEHALNEALKTPREQIAQWGEELLRRHNCELVISRVVEELQRADEADRKKGK